MKIVCMDCQTETYVDVELLRDKKSIECGHCAENIPAPSLGEKGIQLALPSPDDSEFYSARTHAPLTAVTEIEEENILEISEVPYAPRPSELLEIEPHASFNTSEEREADAEEFAAPATRIAEHPVVSQHLRPALLEETLLESSRAAQSSNAFENSATPKQALEAVAPVKASRPARARVLTVGAPIMVVLAVAFAAFMFWGDMIVPKSVGQVDPKPAARSAALPKKEVKQVTASAPAKPSEPVKPAPTPAVVAVEKEPAPKPAPANPPSAPETAKASGQFTIQVGSHNEQAAADKQAAKLTAAGFEARVVRVEIPKRGTWYRVQTGSFDSREEANRHGAQVIAKGAAETFVIAAP